MARTTPDKCQIEAANHFRCSLKFTQVYSAYLIPSIINCFIYVIHFSLDLVVAVQHLREDNHLWAALTLFFMYAPAFAYFILLVLKPDWWMTDDEKLKRGAILWSIIQMGKLLAFPFLALYRYAGLIVLSVDAIILTGDQRRKTLEIAAAPAAIELYFFLQAWLQATPQAVFQAHLLFREQLVPRTGQSEFIHVSCILMSVFVMSMRTSSFERYESQRIVGRKVPWATWLKKPKIQKLKDLEEKQLLSSAAMLPKDKQKMVHENKSAAHHRGTLQKQISSTPPLPPKNVKIIPPPTPLRGITSITRMTVPDLPAPPRPDSIDFDGQDTQLTKSCASSNGEKNKLVAFRKIHSTKIPKQIICKRSYEDNSPVKMISSIMWWFLFILTRILSVVIFFKFYPLYSVGVLGIHYILMISYLLYHTKYNDFTNLFINLWLGLIYIFSIIEYRIKFKNADIWMTMYCILVMLQNTLMTLCWYIYSIWDGLLYSFSFYVIFLSMSLCLSSAIIHYVLLKPKRRQVYAT